MSFHGSLQILGSVFPGVNGSARYTCDLFTFNISNDSVLTYLLFRTVFKVGKRVPGLPIRDCARSFNNRAQMCAQLNAIDVTAKTFFERLYLVLGLRKIAPLVNCSYASTTLIIHFTTISRFLCNFFPRTAPQFFSIMIHQVIPVPSVGNQCPANVRFANVCHHKRKYEEVFHNSSWDILQSSSVEQLAIQDCHEQTCKNQQF